MMFLVQFSPLKPTHLTFNIGKYSRNPVNHAVEICFQITDSFVKAMAAHVIADIPLTDPIQRALKKLLSVGAAFYICAPFLDVGVLAIAKGKHLPKKKKRVVEVFRFAEWLAIMDAVDEYFKPVTKLMVLTGLMASEIAGIKPGCIRDGYLNIEYKIVKGKGADELKTDYRIRRIKITKAIHEILVKAIIDIKGENLFTLPDGRPFSAEKFQRLVWKRALEQAGIAYRKPYTTRHTFAAWSLTLGTDPNRLVSLMGHASKQMVYEVYGKYTQGLEEDREDILGYFGHDFLTRGKQKEEGAKVACRLMKVIGIAGLD